MADDLTKKIDDFQGLLQKKKPGAGLKEEALEAAQEPTNAVRSSWPAWFVVRWDLLFSNTVINKKG